jgi:ATP-dependent 26S proteasome regulatory subunit
MLRAEGHRAADRPVDTGNPVNPEALAALSERPSRELAAELLRTQRQLGMVQRQCGAAEQAAGKLETLMAELLDGNRLLCRLERLRETPRGLTAICRCQGHVRELPVHPQVDLDELRNVQPWEYVTVREQVVVGSWREDPYLLASAQGDVVDFKGYQDRDQHLAIVAHGPEQKTVSLARPLWDETLGPRSRLVLQRDDPHRAIGVVGPQRGRSRFEVPLDQVRTRLEDLAGVEELAAQLLEDIFLRIFQPGLRDQYGLDALKGLLLYSRPGMGKTAFVSAIARWLHDHSESLGFDIVLYIVKPNETKSMWHGEDARIVREELWGAIRARQSLPRRRALVQMVVLDEIDSLGRRAGGADPAHSPAQSDGLEAMLVEMDGMIPQQSGDGPPVHVLCVGMTNRPDRLDEAAKRPGRFDLVLPMPESDRDSAEAVMAVYARGRQLPWYLQGRVHTAVDESDVRGHFLRPALRQVFPAVVLRYKTDTQRSIEVTAGQILANVHFKAAMNRAKKRAALRQLRQTGVPAVTFDDVADSLVAVSVDLARQMEADPQMLIRQLNIKVPVVGVEVVPGEQLQEHHFLRVHAV